ncbi:protein ANTAGONIST OF LIKE HETEROCHROMATIN PROTEIN 1-like isoform X2 [Homarus americanus]|uniref:protein ANTAGONIST OF LIKE HETEROCHROMATIN PROTEIN 1-like isoform X2 n=1 Tax=Homarus americanus TaxID=6706 RepID=UPI001C467E53|nr:protein ANTAGONIST OF LIKE HETEROCHROMATIN PROTEIN 1-like isoform X2 [Homarus americanus]
MVKDWKPDIGEKSRLYWRHEQAKVPFDGVPFMFGGVKSWRCHQGPDFGKRRKAKYREQRDRIERERHVQIKRRTPPVSKKIGCTAMLYAHKLVKFPGYKVSTDSEPSKRSRDKMKKALLQEALTEPGVQMEILYQVRLPSLAAHNHPVPNDITRKRRRIQKVKFTAKTEIAELVPSQEAELTDTDFLHTFRVTKSVYEFLVGEWQHEVAERLMKEGVPVAELDQYKQHVLAALYYFGSTEKLAPASERFSMSPIAFLNTAVRFADFLIRQQDIYMNMPRLDERLVIAEAIKNVSGFPGVMGAMDAALIHMRTPPGPEKQDYCYDKSKAGFKCAFVLQFIVDQRLIFRDIHLDAPSAGPRIQIFQESGAWFTLQNLTSSETHVVAPAVYPLAPAIMTPHMNDVLSYQEALFNENHREALKLAANAMALFKSRFKRMQQLDRHVENNSKFVRASCILHNIALLNEPETVLDRLSLEYNRRVDDEGWHFVGKEETVAEFGILGGEEKRHYLTTVMTGRCDGLLSYVQFPSQLEC